MLKLGWRRSQIYDNDVLLSSYIVNDISGKSFTNKETFGQFPLQVDGFRDIHESLEAGTAQGEIEGVSGETSQSQSGQEVCKISYVKCL